MPLRLARLRPLSVRARLGLIQGFLVAALLLMGLVCGHMVQRERSTGHVLALLSQAERLHLDADQLHDALHADVEAALRLQPGDAVTAAQVLASARGSADRYQRDIAQLRGLPLPAYVASLLARPHQIAADYMAQALRLVETALEDPAAAVAQETRFLDSFDQLLKANDEVTTQLAAQVEQAEQLTIADAASARMWIAVTGLCTTLVAWLVVAAIARSIRGSLRQVSKAARALAAGNLSVRSEVASLDEVGELAGSLNKMADDLQGLIDRLLSDADRDAFSAQLMQALEMAENERDVQEVTARAMAQVAPDLPMEMLLAAGDQAEVRPVAVHPLRGPAGCGVDSLGGCAAIRRGAPLVFNDSDALNACPKLRGRPGGALSAVCVPVTFMGRALGVVHAAAPLRKPPDARQVAQFTAMGTQCGARIGAVRAFARAQMHAYTDALTGLPNRRSLEGAIQELRTEQRPYAFVLADLDRFKALNDTHGHEAGDRALKLFAEVLREHVRQSDVAARWGGEEFALLFRDATAPQVVEVLDRIRAALAEALCASGAPPFTASFGASDSTMAAAQEEIAKLADEALYASKERGRDRISIGGRGEAHPMAQIHGA